MFIFMLFIYLFISGYLVWTRKIWFSSAVLPLVLFSIVACVSLGQNYTQSLLPRGEDGIGISNFLARYLLPEDQWSKELFLSRFELWIGISIGLLLVYFVVIVFEKRNRHV